MHNTLLAFILICATCTINSMQPLSHVPPTAQGSICLAPGYVPVKIVAKNGLDYAYLKSEKSEPVYDLRPYPRTCSNKKVITHIIKSAILFKDPNHVKEYFKNWHGPFNPWDHAREMAESLVAVTQHPHDQVTSTIIAYLLHELHPEHLSLINERVDCLLDAALDNNHAKIIQYIEKTFTFPFNRWALFDAIENNNLKRVESLMQAGISPDIGLGTNDQEQDIVHDGGPQFNAYPSEYAHYPLHLAVHLGFRDVVIRLLKHRANTLRIDHNHQLPLDVATFAFGRNPNGPAIQNRLAIVRRLLDAMPPEKRPVGYHLNMCHIPKTVRSQLRDAYNAYHIPGRICMTDEVESHHTDQPQLTQLEPNTTAVNLGILGACSTALWCCYNKFFCKPTPPKRKIPVARVSVGGKKVQQAQKKLNRK